MNIQNLSSYDPFADLGDESKPDATSQATKKQQTQNYVHIRIQQRNGRKTLTTLQGLPKGTCFGTVIPASWPTSTLARDHRATLPRTPAHIC